ncbi:Arabinanase/levansucrase/invertase [Geopyxis carbonaria]|nr:Arabinanase/levansucrase/invertase [Geopyxis carbonaria]
MVALTPASLLTAALSLSTLASAAAFPPFRRSTTLHKRNTNGPVMSANFPDPSIVKDGSNWWAFATTGNNKNVQVAQSSDFSTWTYQDNTDALPFADGVPGWINSGDKAIWAPDVFQLQSGAFAMTYSAKVADGGIHCIGMGVSTSGPAGPYAKVSDSPFVCPSDTGAIDSSYFRDGDGALYVVYKVDGNCCGKDTPIMVQEVEQDGYTPKGDAVEVLRNGKYDGGITEAPHMIAKDGMQILFFSSNWYNTDYYDVSYATSVDGPRGPFEKSKEPLLVTGGDLGGPGGAAVVVDGDSVKMAFHANEGGPGNAGKSRLMWTTDLGVNRDDRTVSLVATAPECGALCMSGVGATPEVQ